MIDKDFLEELLKEKAMLIGFAQVKLLCNDKKLEQIKKKDPTLYHILEHIFPNNKSALGYIRNHYNKERDGELLGNIAIQVSLLGVCEDLGEQKREAGL